MSDPSQPRTTTQRDPEIVALVAQLRLGGVQGDSHLELQPTRPHLLAQRLLGLERRGHRIRGAGERRHHAVAFALLAGPHAAVTTDCFRQQRIMYPNRRGHRIGIQLPQSGRALDVGQ